MTSATMQTTLSEAEPDIKLYDIENINDLKNAVGYALQHGLDYITATEALIKEVLHQEGLGESPDGISYKGIQVYVSGSENEVRRKQRRSTFQAEEEARRK